MMFRACAPVAGLLVLGSLASAQIGQVHPIPIKPKPIEPVRIAKGLPPPAPNDDLHMQTKIGSFKLVRKGADLPNGRLEFTFAGTVLVSGLIPGSKMTVTGNVREEYDDKEHGKQVFFGRGKMVIIGQFRACQWFGTDLDFNFKGSALIRVTAEFDKNQNTGNYWFDDGVKNPLQVQMITVQVPKLQIGPVPAITREEFEAMKKQQQKGHR
ncbi:MAG TPA: hypothetical protein VMI31_13725 [Fimbriimonadaceae bacterium]|nr:hypothetical protein [Fimbriimonadaceae bacterium]